MSLYDADWWRRCGGPFTEDIIRAACAHAVEEAPDESCGLVVGGDYRRIPNIHADPENAFEMDPEAYGEDYVAGRIEGVVHSHPCGSARPSMADMAAQMEFDLPSAIIIPGSEGDEGRLACWWGGGRPPVFGKNGTHIARAFHHGVADCYTLIRDWYAETREIALPEFPREWEWWRDLETYGAVYLDNLADAGFEIISTDPQQIGGLFEIGDVYLMAVRSKTPNHGGVYLGDGLALDHLSGQLSRVTPISRLARHITHLLRRTGP